MRPREKTFLEKVLQIIAVELGLVCFFVLLAFFTHI
jgi:hypothetical protein